MGVSDVMHDNIYTFLRGLSNYKYFTYNKKGILEIIAVSLKNVTKLDHFILTKEQEKQYDDHNWLINAGQVFDRFLDTLREEGYKFDDESLNFHLESDSE